MAGCTGTKDTEQTGKESSTQVIENNLTTNLYDTSDVVSKKIGEVQFEIPYLWDKDVKENDDFTYYYYNNLTFTTQYTTVDFSNDELISGANEFIDGLKSGFDECTEDEVNTIDISDIKAIEFSANVKLKNKKMSVKILSFALDERLYSFSLVP